MQRSSFHYADGMRVAGINYENVPARITFAEQTAIISEDNMDFRVIGSEFGETNVPFEKMAQVGDCQDAIRLANNTVR